MPSIFSRNGVCSGSRTSSLKESGRRHWLAWFATKLSCGRQAVFINFLSHRAMPRTRSRRRPSSYRRELFCLISALQFHELTLQAPSAVWMGIERTAWRPTIEYPPIPIRPLFAFSADRGCRATPNREGRSSHHDCHPEPLWIVSATATRSASTSRWKACAKGYAAADSSQTTSGVMPG